MQNQITETSLTRHHRKFSLWLVIWNHLHISRDVIVPLLSLDSQPSMNTCKWWEISNLLQGDRKLMASFVSCVCYYWNQLVLCNKLLMCITIVIRYFTFSPFISSSLYLYFYQIYSKNSPFFVNFTALFFLNNIRITNVDY